MPRDLFIRFAGFVPFTIWYEAFNNTFELEAQQIAMEHSGVLNGLECEQLMLKCFRQKRFILAFNKAYLALLAHEASKALGIIIRFGLRPLDPERHTKFQPGWIFASVELDIARKLFRRSAEGGHQALGTEITKRWSTEPGYSYPLSAKLEDWLSKPIERWNASQNKEHGADPGCPLCHLHKSPPRFHPGEELVTERLRRQRFGRSPLRHSASLPRERSDRAQRCCVRSNANKQRPRHDERGPKSSGGRVKECAKLPWR
jgi:hypothetical protein